MSATLTRLSAVYTYIYITARDKALARKRARERRGEKQQLGRYGSLSLSLDLSILSLSLSFRFFFSHTDQPDSPKVLLWEKTARWAGSDKPVFMQVISELSRRRDFFLQV